MKVFAGGKFELPSVTRVEVIGKNGRLFVGYFEEGAEAHMQDGGRTLKVFVGDVVDPAKVVR